MPRGKKGSGLKEKLDKKEEEYKNLFSQYQRLTADFENYKKRTEKERTSLRTGAREELIKKFLEVSDNLDRALAASEKTSDPTSVASGVALIADQMHAILSEEGVDAICAEGENFDPALHEAVTVEHSDHHPEGTVIEELQRGYKLKDKTIRPTKVKVSKGKQNG